MTPEELLRQPAILGPARRYAHPLTALFGALGCGTRRGMQIVTDRGGIFSDLWERYPEPHEVTWHEVLACFRAARVRLNPAWCEFWESSIQSKILGKTS